MASMDQSDFILNSALQGPGGIPVYEVASGTLPILTMPQVQTMAMQPSVPVLPSSGTVFATGQYGTEVAQVLSDATLEAAAPASGGATGVSYFCVEYTNTLYSGGNWVIRWPLPDDTIYWNDPQRPF